MTENYVWEAEKADGTIVTKGEDLTGCVRFSLIPVGLGIISTQGGIVQLQRFDLIGVKMKRRFVRGFLHGLGGGQKDYIHCIVCDGFRVWVSYKNGQVRILPEDYELMI